MQPLKTSNLCQTCKKKDDPKSSQHHQLLIACDCCKLWYHNTCQGLTKGEANLIAKGESKGIKWFCKTCCPALLIKNSKQASRTTDDRLEAIEGAIKSLEECCVKSGTSVTSTNGTAYADALKVDMEKIQKTVGENTTNIKQSHDMLKATLDQSDAEARKVNAILFGLIEEEGKAVSDQVSEFMAKECFTSSPKPISAFRLGQKKADKHRPIKVKFNDEHSKWEFVKRVNANFRGDNIFCKLDSNQEARDKEYAMRLQMRQLRDENKSNQYRIRDTKIQEKQPSGEWVEMKPVTATKVISTV